MNKGCYAEVAGPLTLHWRKVTEGVRGSTWGGFLTIVRKLPKGQLWRHNQAGDLPGMGNNLDVHALRDLVNANRGKRGFTYTHKPLTTPWERQAVADANASGFTINLSANNLAHADELLALRAGPVVVVLDQAEGDNTAAITPGGHKVVVCPATYRDDVTCMSCQLCQRQRDCIVGFPAHGARKNAAAQIAKGA
jgi:hypothetical protein